MSKPSLEYNGSKSKQNQRLIDSRGKGEKMENFPEFGVKQRKKLVKGDK